MRLLPVLLAWYTCVPLDPQYLSSSLHHTGEPGTQLNTLLQMLALHALMCSIMVGTPAVPPAGGLCHPDLNCASAHTGQGGMTTTLIMALAQVSPRRLHPTLLGRSTPHVIIIHHCRLQQQHRPAAAGCGARSHSGRSG